MSNDKLAFYNMDDFNFNGRKVLIRVDINSPIDPKTGAITDDTRIRSHAQTIQELLDKGAAVAILAHQGRPGDSDFTTLAPHAAKLSKFLKGGLNYIEDIFGPAAKSMIQAIKPGEALLLENVRFYSEENIEKVPEAQARTFLVKTLSPLFSVYVNDAFATAHRGHPSLVGFPVVMPSCGGRLLESEVEFLSSVFTEDAKPCIFMLGGGKVADSVQLMETLLPKGLADKVLLTGMISHLFLVAEGKRVGKATLKIMEGKGLNSLLPRAKALLSTYRERIVTPMDAAVLAGGERKEVDFQSVGDEMPLYDIGQRTIDAYCEIIRSAKTVIMRGPAGYIEDPKFCKGSEELLRCLVESNVRSLLGGGHLRSISERMSIADKIGYFSTGGGAFITFLSGERMPALEVLITSAQKFKSDR